MSRIEANKTFDNKTIRVTRDDEQQEWYFSLANAFLPSNSWEQTRTLY